MPMTIKRRAVLAGITGAAILTTLGPSSAQNGEVTIHEVEMLNQDPDNPRERMVFAPNLVVAQPGDTVRWLPVDPGHNTQSIDNAVPEGAEAWRSTINKEFEITLTTPGFFVYKCLPHFATGMVGLIVVQGDGMTDNLETARSVRARGKAAERLEQIWAKAEAEGLLSAA